MEIPAFIGTLANSTMGTDEFVDRHAWVPPVEIAHEKLSRSAFSYK
jgi:hypothetical protein